MFKYTLILYFMTSFCLANQCIDFYNARKKNRITVSGFQPNLRTEITVLVSGSPTLAELQTTVYVRTLKSGKRVVLFAAPVVVFKKGFITYKAKLLAAQPETLKAFAALFENVDQNLFQTYEPATSGSEMVATYNFFGGVRSSLSIEKVVSAEVYNGELTLSVLSSANDYYRRFGRQTDSHFINSSHLFSLDFIKLLLKNDQ